MYVRIIVNYFHYMSEHISSVCHLRTGMEVADAKRLLRSQRFTADLLACL
jgi:hypothetical protein